MPGVTVLTPDLPGYGGHRPQVELSLAAQADEVVRILRRQAQGHCHLLGYSVGRK